MEKSLPKTGQFVCPCCERIFDGRRSFGTHLGRKHPEYGGIKQYVLRQQLNGVEPLCLCGCGQLVAWHKTEYRYVDYVSGHNETTYDISKHVMTEEQRVRAAATYAARIADPDDPLRDTISQSVTRAYQDPQKKQNLVEGQLRGWKDPARRARRVDQNHVMWEDPDHYDKVFTPEMRRKVGINNMTRDVQRVSKEEQEFVAHLCQIFGDDDVLASSWINSPTHGTGCFDVYLRSVRCRVEYDGVHHHGLDRESGWTDWQLDNMANDRRKDEMVRERPGARLLRIRSDSDWRSIGSFADLEMLAYMDVRGPARADPDVACDRLEYERAERFAS